MTHICPEPNANPPNIPFILCKSCKSEIYQGEKAYDTQDGIICGECLDEIFSCMSRTKKVDLILGLEIEVEK